VQAFLWGSLTGFAEPLGGLLGFLVLDEEEPLTFAVVFGLVAGIMAFVSFKELLPSAFRFDPTDSVVSTSERLHPRTAAAAAAGMRLPALLLLLLLLLGHCRCCCRLHACSCFLVCLGAPQRCAPSGLCRHGDPSAHAGIIVGMGVMAASLLLFTI
jgi:hypothetical protein